MASTRRCPLTLLLAATCLLHTATVVAGKGLPAWTGIADARAPQLFGFSHDEAELWRSH